MRVLAVASQKERSGKSTLAGHLAVQAARMGMGPVVLVDLDPEEALTAWWNERAAEHPAMAETSVARLPADIELLRRQGYSLVVIDTPTDSADMLDAVVRAADLILIPTRPDPEELQAAGATVAQCGRSDLPLIFALNGAIPHSEMNARAAMILSQHGTVAPITIHHRPDFGSSMSEGRTVMEAEPGGHSAAEIASLWAFVADSMETRFRRTVFTVPGPNSAAAGVPRGKAAFGRRGVA